MERAAQALRWLRMSTAARSAELELFQRAEHLLDVLMTANVHAETELGFFGVDLLRIAGFELEFSSCVVCGRPCPEDRAGLFHPGRGGLVCRGCGGGPLLVPSTLRRRITERASPTTDVLPPSITDKEAELLLALVERALQSHMG